MENGSHHCRIFRWARLSSAGVALALSLAASSAPAFGLEEGKQGEPGKCNNGLSPGENSVLASRGNDVAQCMLGRAYELGKGVERNLRKAAELYQQAANKGNVDAQYRLGHLLEIGGPDLPADPKFAVSMYQAAARYGQTSAQYRLGYALQHGIGIEKNAEQAVIWYKRAADKGLAAARNSLGLMYLTGNGVPRNYALAAELFKAAAAQGYSWAQNNLAGLYELGWGVEQDLAQARRLYVAASANDNPGAKRNLERLARHQVSDNPASTHSVPTQR